METRPDTHQNSFIIGAQTFITLKVNYTLKMKGGTFGKHQRHY